MKKLNEWSIILEDNLLNHDWHKEESSDTDSEEDISEDDEEDDDDDDDEEEDSDEEMEEVWDTSSYWIPHGWYWTPLQSRLDSDVLNLMVYPFQFNIPCVQPKTVGDSAPCWDASWLIGRDLGWYPVGVGLFCSAL